MHPRERVGDRGGESLILKSAKKEKGVSVKKRGDRSLAHCHSFDEHFSARVRSVCSRRRLLFSQGDREVRRGREGEGKKIRA